MVHCAVWSSTGTVSNRPPLARNAFNPLPLTAVKASGWLRNQLRIQAEGMSGHLDEFWPDVGPNSGWLGGPGESWERGPYFLDGLVPLAYLTGDQRLIAKAKKWVDWTLEHQRPDGSIGPEKNTDWWPNMVMLKVLTQYQEATGDPRVIPVMEKYFAYQARSLDQRPLQKWAVYRWQDEALSVVWLYNRNGDEKLLDLARKLHDQGYDWNRQFENFPFTTKGAKGNTNLKSHVVNNAMALKTAAVWSLVSGEKADRDALYRQFQLLDRYHLLPNGVHSGDEHLAGLNPTQGTELCAVVEAMFSLETILSVIGDPMFGDRLEKIAYNPLPGTFSADMWAHQYDQQPNQVLCNIYPRDWTTNDPDSNIFGLEPNFGCCTANYHQGWPKYTASLWMATPGQGLAAIAYAPSEVNTTIRGVPVKVVEETDYPFRERIRLQIDPESPVQFDLQLRIPQWAANATATVNGERMSGLHPASFYKIDRRWNRGDRVELILPMRVRTSRWYAGSVDVERGPLVFSLRIQEDWRKIKQHGPAADWEVYPKSDWNYGLVVNENDPASSFEVKEKPVSERPFSPEGAPVVIEAKGRKIPDWQLVNGSAGPLPQSPASSSEPEETLTLLPYGSAKLRITAFPLLRK
jgi:DUF1680 family protein